LPTQSSLSLTNTFERLELNLHDAWFKLRGVQQPGGNFIIIALDKKSIAKIGPPPWPRSVHVSLLEQLKKAKVAGFDLLFDVPGDPAIDTQFSDALKRNGHVVLASFFKYEQDKGEWYQQLLSPAKPLGTACAGTGFINMPEDIDGVTRNATLIDTNIFKRPYSSLDLAIVLAYEGFAAPY